MKIQLRTSVFASIVFILLSYIQIHSASDFVIKIGTIHNAVLGSDEEVPVFMNQTPRDFMGFDFLISHDPSVLSLISVKPGLALFSDSSCGWEYFAYRYGPSAHCGQNACPIGITRVVGIAETQLGDYPTCLNPSPDSVLFTLHFLLTSNHTFECQFYPIAFIWYDCTDNLLWIGQNDTTYVAAGQANTFEFEELLEPAESFPSTFGIFDSCTTAGTGYTTERTVDFHHGGVDFIFIDPPIDDRGDINLNGLPNEVADAVLFTNYFIYGFAVFTVNVEGQISASDINRDGEMLKLEDLVSLWRIISGDSQPFFEPFDSTSPNIATFTNHTEPGRSGVEVIDVSTLDTLGAIQLIFSGDIIPTSLNSNTAVGFNYENGLTTILVQVILGETSFILQGPLISYTGSGELIQARTASYTGVKINTIVDFSSDIGDENAGIFPTDFALRQNYPNPFNNSTVISFDLPKASNVEFEIINLLGQPVFRGEKRYSAGTHSISWDGVDENGLTVSSGMYYYRIVAGDFVASKKMILLK